MSNKTKQSDSGNKDTTVEDPSSRRRTLKKLLAGTGVVAGSAALPEKWAKPTVSSAVLPAHATATGVQLAECNDPVGARAGIIEAAYFENAEVGWEFIPPATEADSGTPVDVEIRLGVEVSANGTAIPTSVLEYNGVVESGQITGIPTSTPFEAISETEAFEGGIGSRFEVNFDIGNDGTIDCDFDARLEDQVEE